MYVLCREFTHFLAYFLQAEIVRTWIGKYMYVSYLEVQIQSRDAMSKVANFLVIKERCPEQVISPSLH